MQTFIKAYVYPQPMNDLCYLETKFWKVLLHPNQAYFGRSIVCLKRPCPSLSALKDEEFFYFQQNVVVLLERFFSNEFNATPVNWACLMNNAYKKEKPRPQVHWHIIPRYKTKVEAQGIIFTDTEFSHHYNLKREHVLSEQTLAELAENFRTLLIKYCKRTSNK